MNKGAFLYAGGGAVCLGIALALVWSVGLLLPLVFVVGAALLLVLYIVYSRKELIFAAMVLCAAVVGLTRTELFLSQQTRASLVPYVGQQSTLEGVVTNDPERRETSLHVTVEVSSIDSLPLSSDRHGSVLVLLGRDEKVSYGDTVVVKGVLAVPQSFETDTGHTFDYAGYLSVQGISVTMQRAQLISVQPGGWSAQGSLFALKHLFEGSIEKLFPEPDGALLEGILLGERRGIPNDLNQAFISSGLVHVVVLSGYNISIVAAGVFEVLRFLPRVLSLSTGAIVMILFALMTGAGATTVRALVMALIVLFAKYIGRSAVPLRSLAVAGAAMALWNPPTLLHDPSFILSMLATFGLITLSPWVESHLPPMLLRFPTVRGIVGATVSVQIFVLPALLYFTGVLSFLSVPANALALPVVSFAMLAGFVAGLLGLLHPALAFAPAIVADLLLKWMIAVASCTQIIPFATTTIPAFSAWIVAALYIPLTWFAILLYQRSVARSSAN